MRAATTVAPTSTDRRPGIDHSMTGSNTVATIEPSETNRVRATVTPNAAVAMSVGHGANTPKTPLAVATPFPPLKPNHTG